VFPLQATILLSGPNADFAGGEFLWSSSARACSPIGQVCSLGQGDAVIFAVNERRVRGSRGVYRTALRHGVSRLPLRPALHLGVYFS